MKLSDTVRLYAGGPGSGCQGPNCGRKAGGGKPARIEEDGWVTKDGQFFPNWGTNSHYQTAVNHKLTEKGAGEWYDREADALRQGHVRVTMNTGKGGRSVALEAWKKDEHSADLIDQIVSRLPSDVSSVTVKFRAGGSESGELYSGGLGSGCKGPNCGRKPIGDDRAVAEGEPITMGGWMTRRGVYYQKAGPFVDHKDMAWRHGLGSTTNDALKRGNVQVQTFGTSDHVWISAWKRTPEAVDLIDKTLSQLSSDFRTVNLFFEEPKAEEKVFTKDEALAYLHSYGTSEGTRRAWDTRGRGRAMKGEIGDGWVTPEGRYFPKKLWETHEETARRTGLNSPERGDGYQEALERGNVRVAHYDKDEVMIESRQVQPSLFHKIISHLPVFVSNLDIETQIPKAVKRIYREDALELYGSVTLKRKNNFAPFSDEGPDIYEVHDRTGKVLHKSRDERGAELVKQYIDRVKWPMLGKRPQAVQWAERFRDGRVPILDNRQRNTTGGTGGTGGPGNG